MKIHFKAFAAAAVCGTLALIISTPAHAAGFVVSRDCGIFQQLDSSPASGSQTPNGNTADCSFAIGVAADGTGYTSGTSFATSGSVRASSEIGKTFQAFGSAALVTESLPGDRSSSSGLNTSAFMDDIVTVEGLTVPYIDAVFGVTLNGLYGAHAGDSGGGSIIGTFFNAIGSLEDRTSQTITGFNVDGCATDKSVFSDHGSQCNGTLDFLGGGTADDTYLLHMRIANDEQIRIQLKMIVSTSAFIDNGADPLAYAGGLFGHSLDWAGLISATDPDGNAYTGPLTALAPNGFDYADSAAAPEPGTFFLAGLAIAIPVFRRLRR